MLLSRDSGVGRELTVDTPKGSIPRVLLLPFQVGRLPFVGDISDVYSLCIYQGR